MYVCYMQIKSSSVQFSAFDTVPSYGNIPTRTLVTGALSAGQYKNSRFLTNISLCLGKDTRYSHSYYEMQIRSRKQLSNSTIFNDLERPLVQISRLRHYLTLNISETVQDAEIVTMEL